MVMSWTSFKPYESGGYVYPLWANVVGVSFLALCILPLPIGAVFNVAVEQKGSLVQVCVCAGTDIHSIIQSVPILNK